MKTTIMTKKTGTTRGFVAGYPTKIGRKVFDTGYSVTYEAENEEFGEGERLCNDALTRRMEDEFYDN